MITIRKKKMKKPVAVRCRISYVVHCPAAARLVLVAEFAMKVKIEGLDYGSCRLIVTV